MIPFTSKKLGLDTIIGSDIFDEIDKNHSGQGSVNLEKLKELVKFWNSRENKNSNTRFKSSKRPNTKVLN